MLILNDRACTVLCSFKTSRGKCFRRMKYKQECNDIQVSKRLSDDATDRERKISDIGMFTTALHHFCKLWEVKRPAARSVKSKIFVYWCLLQDLSSVALEGPLCRVLCFQCFQWTTSQNFKMRPAEPKTKLCRCNVCRLRFLGETKMLLSGKDGCFDGSTCCSGYHAALIVPSR